MKLALTAALVSTVALLWIYHERRWNAVDEAITAFWDQ